ncbi:MAG: PIN domain-containing protein, partial [Cyanobacteria bacterium P01_H01_bin.119]
TALFALIEDNEIQGYIAATTITNIFYVVRKLRSREVALQAISQLLRGLNLCDVGHQVIQQALSIDLKDFEDGVQLACAIAYDLDAIATRNTADFRGAEFVILSADELIAQFSADEP